MSKRNAFFPAACVAVASIILLTGCGAAVPSPASTKASTSDSQPSQKSDKKSKKSADEADGPAVPGYAVGEIPPVPLFALPDLSLLNSALSGFTFDFAELVGDYPGLTIAPAACDEAGERKSGNGSVYLYGDGSGTFTSPDGTVTNYGNGAGSYVVDGVTVTVNGDGSGAYIGSDITITNNGDGSGTYITAEKNITIDGKGAGTYVDGDATITISGDGAGTYVSPDVTTTNNGDGSGTYVSTDIVIENYGDGTGLVNGVEMKLDALPPVPKLGAFPPLGVLKPITSCGTTITLDAGVLFDFDKFDIRPDAATTLESLIKALNDADVPSAEIGGHTDAVGSDDANQTLSEERANAVVQALLKGGVSAELSAVGYGESKPVAPNETADGTDNAAGRQLNRRVEIFIPAF